MPRLLIKYTSVEDLCTFMAYRRPPERQGMFVVLVARGGVVEAVTHGGVHVEGVVGAVGVLEAQVLAVLKRC